MLTYNRKWINLAHLGGSAWAEKQIIVEETGIEDWSFSSSNFI
jgi:hypothetical protein